MTTPLSGQQLTEIRTEVDRLRAESELRLDEAQRAYVFDTADLKRENARLRAELERQDGEARFLHFEYQAAMDNYKGENWQVGQLRAEVEQLRKERDALTMLYDDAEQHVGELLGLAATPACSCAAEAVHQAGCEAT